MAIEHDTVTAPDYWASYLVNGDDSGLELDEKVACDAWQDTLGDWYVVDVARHESGEAQEPRFTWSYRLYGGTASGGNVLDYVVHRRQERAGSSCPYPAQQGEDGPIVDLN